VEITGGEPLFQENTPFLVDLLVQRGLTVLVETNGTLDIRQIGKPCIRIMDVKCPSSGESKRNDLENLARLGDDDEVKFVIADSGDYAYAWETLRRLPDRFTRRGNIHFSPAFGRMAPGTLAAWILRDRINVRLHLQLHKYIWSPGKRGV
jgi:7-carboxy-7-deazaguanine synthase